MKARYYESIPAELVVSMVPSFSANVQPQKLSVVSHSSSSTADINAIEKRTEDLIKKCKDRCRRGDYKAIAEILSINPAFILEAWIANKYHDLLKSGFFSRGQGRRFGSRQYHPLTIVGLVQSIIDTGKARNRDQSFVELARLGFGAYETIKKNYYDTLRNKYIKPLMLKKHGEWRKLDIPT